ncbi:MAG: endolytic transglycosylase MltG [Psychrilyobacter sp.]|nr:endolytic transglycosylase MltG [Psychrilyobacter sp.]
MRVIKFFLLSVILAVVILSSSYYYNINIKKTEIHQTIELKRGESVRGLLKELNLKESIFVKAYFRFTGASKGVKAGYYEIDGSYNIPELFDLLKDGKAQMVRLTIPEGLTVEEIKEILIKKNMATGEEFDSVLSRINFPYLTPNGNFEGYLFPETYYISKGATPTVIINTLLSEFLKNYPVEKYGKNKKEFYKKLIMGSVIEREAVVDVDKPLIASVFYNRLKKGMRLESDATVNYIFGYKKRRIYYKDLKIESPYNTYRIHGLPIAPIGNPGKVAIDAAINPAKTKFYFFVAKYDGSQSHKFTKTYKEHLDYQKKNKNKPK